MISRERVTSATKRALGLELPYGLTEQDFEAMAELSGKGTREVIENAQSLTTRKLAESQIFLIASELAAAGMIRLLHPDNFTDEKKAILWLFPLAWFANWACRVASTAPINELVRRQEIALLAFIAQVQDETSSNEVRTLLSATTAQITGLPASVRVKPQWQTALIMIAQQINLATLVPDLIPAIAFTSALGVAQIYSAARFFRKAQSEFVEQMRETIFRLVKHETLIDAEKKKLEVTLKRAARIPQMINTLTYAAPTLTAVMAIVEGQLSQLASTATLAAYNQGLMSGRGVSDSMSGAVTSQVAIGNGVLGREALHEVIRVLKSTRLIIKSEQQYQELRDEHRIDSSKAIRPQTDDTYFIAQDLEPRRLDGSQMFDLPYNMMINVGSREEGYSYVAVEGRSGTGKSSFLHRLGGMAVHGEGSSGFISKDALIDFMGYDSIDVKRERVWSNLTVEETNYWMDQAYTTEDLLKILRENGFSDNHPACSLIFLRSSWPEKIAQAQENARLNDAVEALQSHAVSYLQSTGLFAEHEDAASILLRPINQNSLGQITRINLSLAGVKPRDVYLIDEPLQGLEFVHDESNDEHTAATRVCLYILSLLQHAPVFLNDKHLDFITEHLGSDKLAAVLTLTKGGIQTSTKYMNRVVIHVGKDEMLPHFEEANLVEAARKLQTLFSDIYGFSEGWILESGITQFNMRSAGRIRSATEEITVELDQLLILLSQSREFVEDPLYLENSVARVIPSDSLRRLPRMWAAHWRLMKTRYESGKIRKNPVEFWQNIQPMLDQIVHISSELLSRDMINLQGTFVLDEWIDDLQSFWAEMDDGHEKDRIEQELAQYRLKITRAASHIPGWIQPSFEHDHSYNLDTFLHDPDWMASILNIHASGSSHVSERKMSVTTLSEKFEGRGSDQLLEKMHEDHRFVVCEISGLNLPFSLDKKHVQSIIDEVSSKVEHLSTVQTLIVWIHDYEPSNIPHREFLYGIISALQMRYESKVRVITRTKRISNDMFSVPQNVNIPIMCLGLCKVMGAQEQAQRLQVPLEWIHRKVGGNTTLLQAIGTCSVWDEVQEKLEDELLRMIKNSAPNLHCTINASALTREHLMQLKPVVRNIAMGYQYERACEKAYPNMGADNIRDMQNNWYAWGILAGKPKHIGSKAQRLFIPEVMAVLGS